MTAYTLTRWRGALGVTIALGLCPPVIGWAAELASGELLIRGAVLRVEPEFQEVDPGRPTVVRTSLGDLAVGAAPAGLRVEAELSGPGLTEPLPLSTLPGEAFQIPGLSREGRYSLSGICLVDGGRVVMEAQPGTVEILVHRLVIASVTSRPLTREEIASYGIVIDQDNYTAYRYTVGFAVESETYEVTFDLVNGPQGLSLLDSSDPYEFPRPPSGAVEMKLPRINPGVVRTSGDFEPEPQDLPSFGGGAPTIPGFLIFPSDVAFLNQFFAVIVVVQNGALEGNGIELRDLSAFLELGDVGVRLAETTPPTVPGEPLPILDPGPDGEPGTSDDLTIIVAGASGEGTWLVEGLEQGRHLVVAHLSGEMHGLASGEVAPLEGAIPGVVLVRDPRFALTFFHPWTVRAGEQYDFRVVVTNTGTTPVYDLSLRLPESSISGAVLVEPDPEQMVGTLLPGEEAMVTWRLEALETGRVVAGGFNSSSPIDASFRFEVGVGELGVPLSPESLVLPPEVDALPEGFRTSALELLGLAYSMANAPAGAAVDLPPVGEAVVQFRGAELAAAARRYAYGADLDWSLMSLGLKWLGADLWSDGFEALRRASRRGHELEDHLAAATGARVATVGPETAFAELEEAAITGRPALVVYAGGAGFEGSARLAVQGLASGKRSIGQGADVGLFERGLPGAAILEVDGTGGWTGEVGVVAIPLDEDGLGWREPTYQVQLEGIADGKVDLEAVLVLPDGSTRRFAPSSPVPMDAHQKAWLSIAQEADTATLYVDDNGDGVGVPLEEITAASRQALEPRVLVARLDRSLNPITAGPARNLLFLFSQPVDVDVVASLDVSDWMISSHLELTAGGAPLAWDRPRRGAGVRAQSDPNFLVVTADTALTAHAEMKLTTGAYGVPFLGGRLLDLVDEPIAVGDGLLSGGVRGVVVGGDGALVPGAEVELYEYQRLDDWIQGSSWEMALSDRVRADANGGFVLDAVRYRQGQIDSRYASFLIRARDPSGGHEARLRASLTGDATVRDLSVFMVGRGDVVGRLTREDGASLGSAEIHGRSVTNPEESAVVAPDAEGAYRLSDLPVGPIQIMASDGRDYTFGTAMISGPGQEARLDLVLPTRTTPLAQVRGSVLDGDTTAPLGGVQVYLSPPGAEAASHVAVTDGEGVFQVVDVPAGLTTFRVWDPARGLYVAEHQQQLLGDATNTVEIVTFGEATGTVRGTVYRTDAGIRTPLAGGYVIARACGRYAVTEADGGYRLEDLPVGTVRLEALDPATGEGASRTVELTADGQEVVVDLDVMGASGRIQATVYDRAGVPQQGVRVAVDRFGGDSEGVTDGNGATLLEGLQPGSYTLLAERGGRLGRTSGVRILCSGHTAEAQILLGDLVSLEVETVADTTGGGTAQVVSRITYRRPGVTRSGSIGSIPDDGELECAPDDEGICHIDDLPEVPERQGSLTAFARNPFYGQASVSEALDPSDDGRRLTINFSAPGAISGRVLERVDDELAPVAGAVVELWSDNHARARVLTEADGLFSFDLLPPGDFSVRAYSPASGGIGLVNGWIYSAQVLTDLDITLRGSGGIEGRVSVCYMTAKALQEGEEVHLELKPQWAPSPFISDLEIPQLAERSLDVTLDENREAAFTFTGLSLRTWNLRASSALHGTALETYHLAEEGVVVGADEPICLHPAGSVSGAVIFPETGAGAESVTVQLYRAVNLLPEEWVATDATTASGSYRFPDLPVAVAGTVRYRVRAYDAGTNRGGESSMVRLCATDNPAFGDTCWLDATLDVALSGLGEVSGVVLDQDGRGVGDAYVRLRSQVVVDQNGSIVTAGREWVTFAAGDGSYSFTGIPAGQVEVSAFDPDSPLWVLAVGIVDPDMEPVSRLDLQLPATAEVTVRVHDPAGQVVQEGTPRVAFTQGSSRFREPSGTSPTLSRLLSGSEVTIAGVAADGFTTGACLGEECAALLPDEILGHRFQAALGARGDGRMDDPPTDRSLDLELMGRAAVVVQVAQGGVPVEGAEVALAGNGFYGPVNVVTQSGADGTTSSIANLGVGEYTASAKVTDAYGNTLRGATELVIGQGDHDRALLVDVALEDAGAADGQVFLSDGAAAVAALLTMTMHGSGRRFQSVVGADGGFELAALPSGATYELEVFQADGVERYLEHDVAISSEVHHFGEITLDGVNPTVATVTPGNGAQEVNENVTVAIDFSEPMRHESLTGERVRLRRSGSSTPVTVTPTAQDFPDPDGDGPGAPYTRVTLQPSVLASDTLYVVDVLRGVEDLAGRSLGVDAHFTFRTRDSWPPSVTGVVPANDPSGAHPVGPDVEPAVSFSEAVDPDSVSDASVRLTDGGGQPVGVQRVIEDSGFTIRLRPTSALSLDTFYTIDVAGVTDTSGNPLQAAISSTFRVRDATPPTVTLLPPSGATVDGDSWTVLEGRAISLRAVVASNDALSSVSFSANGALLGHGGLDPASGEFRMAYTTPQDISVVTLAVQALDVSGNLSAQASHLLALTADNPPAGTVTVSPAEAILPNHILTATVDAQDDLGLAKVSFNVDGGMIQAASVTVSGTSAQVSRSFRVPVTSTAGTDVVVTCEVQDSLGQRTPLAPQSVKVISDEQQPAAIVLEPEPGTEFRSGQVVPFRFALSDDVTVESSSLVVDNEPVALALGSIQEPGTDWSADATATWMVPEIEVEREIPWTLSLADHVGNSFEATGTLSLVPLANPEAPVVTIPCPQDGDLVAAGVPTTIDVYLMEDDEGDQVQSYSMFVDDVLVVADVAVNAVELSASVPWTPPADAAPGTTCQIRVEARDFAGNVGAAQVTLVVVGGSVLAGDRTIDSSYDGQDLVLASGTFTASCPLAPRSLTVLKGGVLTGESRQEIRLTLPGGVTVQCGGRIHADGKGYAYDGTTYPGETRPTGGGNHIGSGGTVSSAPGATYGSVYRPLEMGSAGSGSSGRPGGGVLRIAAADLEVDGSISASGHGSLSFNGGAGGSAWITVTGEVTGTGSIAAVGGRSGSGGDGGGGAIALEYGSISPEILASLNARGGDLNDRLGGAGSIYLCQHGVPAHGDLVIDNRGVPGSWTVLPPLGSGTVQPGSRGRVLVTDRASIQRYFVGHWVEVRDVAGELKGTWKIASIDAGTITFEEADAGVAEGDAWQGVYRFDHLRLGDGVQLKSDDPVRVAVSTEVTGVVTTTRLEGRDLRLLSGARLSPPAQPRSQSTYGEVLELELSGTLTVEEGASISADGKGYSYDGTTYPGETKPLGGGNHIGVGGTGSPLVGATYGSVYRPLEMGSAGRGASGTAGGGVVRIAAASLDLGGSISAGGYGSGSFNAGAGGSVWVSVAGAIVGAGSIRAAGGQSVNSGDGGGGAIAVEYGSISPAILANLNASGGDLNAYLGGAGSIYLYQSDVSTYGDLVVDNRGLAGSWSVLPSLGSGVAQAGSGGLTLVTDRASIQPYFVGHWVQVYDPSGGLKGTRRIASIDNADGTSVLTFEGVDAAVAEGDTWRGVYRFDSVTVRGSARLQLDDLEQFGSVTVEAGSSLAYGNAGAPVIDPGLIAITADQAGYWVTASAGTVSDPDGIASAQVVNVVSSQAWPVTMNGDGSFGPVAVAGAASDGIRLDATDAHRAPMTSQVVVGVLPDAVLPEVDPALFSLQLTTCDPRLVAATDAVTGAGGAVVVIVTVDNPAPVADWTSEALEVVDGQPFELGLQKVEPGAAIRVSAVAAGSPPAQVTVATAPQAAPEVDPSRLNRWYWSDSHEFEVGIHSEEVKNRLSAVSFTLSNLHPERAASITFDGPCGPGSYASRRLPAEVGDRMQLVACNGSDPAVMVCGAPIDLGPAPFSEYFRYDLGGAGVKGMWRAENTALVATTGGHGRLLRQLGSGWMPELLMEAVEEPHGDMRDIVRGTFWGVGFVDGSYLESWEDMIHGELEPLGPGVTVEANLIRDNFVFAAGRDTAANAVIFTSMTPNGYRLTMSCPPEAVVTVPGTAGRHALELVQLASHRIGIVLDGFIDVDGQATPIVELDVVDPMAPIVVDDSAVTLPGLSSAPVTALLDDDHLEVRTADGILRLFRLTAPRTFELRTELVSLEGAAPTAAARLGDSLFVGYEDGALVRYAYADDYYPALIPRSEMPARGEPVLALAATQNVLVVAFPSGVEAHLFRPDEVTPELERGAVRWDGRRVSFAGGAFSTSSAGGELWAHGSGIDGGGASAAVDLPLGEVTSVQWTPLSFALADVVGEITDVDWERVSLVDRGPTAGEESLDLASQTLVGPPFLDAACYVESFTCRVDHGAAGAGWRAVASEEDPAVRFRWTDGSEWYDAEVWVPGASVHGLAAAGQRLVATGQQVSLIDLTDPSAHPMWSSDVFPGEDAGEVVTVAGRSTAVVAAREGLELAVVDVSAAGAPTVLTTPQVLADGAGNVRELYVDGAGDIWVLASTPDRLLRLSGSALPSISLLGEWALAVGDAEPLAVDGGTLTFQGVAMEALFVLRDGWGIEMYDAADLGAGPLAAIPLPGDPGDIWVGDLAEGVKVLVAAGLDSGVLAVSYDDVADKWSWAWVADLGDVRAFAYAEQAFKPGEEASESCEDVSRGDVKSYLPESGTPRLFAVTEDGILPVPIDLVTGAFREVNHGPGGLAAGPRSAPSPTVGAGRRGGGS